MALKYRIREVSTVTDEHLERVVNETVAEGWDFDGIQFAMRDSSKRPSMAFLVFFKEVSEEPDEC